MFHCHKKETEEKLFCNTQENYPSRSAAVAGDRKFDVYMGIDVFGRNTYGGGQWNVWLILILWDASIYIFYRLVFWIPVDSLSVHQTDVALNVLKKDDVSAAIFAPGWVYETNQPPDFQTAQNR